MTALHGLNPDISIQKIHTTSKHFRKKARGALASRAGTTIGRGMLALVMTTRYADGHSNTAPRKRPMSTHALPTQVSRKEELIQ